MSEAPALAVLALHQRSAPLDARERIAAGVAALPARADLLTLSSCHRVELYAAGDLHLASVHALLGPDLADDLTHARWLSGHAAVAHLFRVAAGIDSVVVGEGQIAGQLKRALLAGRERGLHPVLDRALQRALALAREIRATTALGRVARSVGSIAVEEAVTLLRAPSTATALVVGAGEIGKLSARALGLRVSSVIVANRDVARAMEVAERIGGRAIPLDRLPQAIEEADVVISAADTRGRLITRELLASRAARRPLVVIDIAVPRSVAEDARDLPGLTYRDVDGLSAAHAAVPADAVAHAERRCAEEARAFMAELHGRAAAATIRALRERADRVRARQVERALRKLSHLGPRDRRVVEGLAASLAGALVHAPTVALRRAPEREEAARALFELDGKDGP